MADGRYLIRSRYVRGLTTGAFVVFALIAASGFANQSGSGLAFPAVMVIILAVLAFRAWRSATVVVGEQEVVVRSLLRTRRWPLSEVREFVAATRSLGMGGWRRHVLGIVFVDGATRWLSEINSRPPRQGASWIDEAVSKLNRPEGS